MRAFEGIKVIDCTHVIAAPFATYQLAVLGADVIKVEDPNEPDQSRQSGPDKDLNKAMMGTGFLAQGSNKRAIAIDLKTAGGREVLKRLVSNWADVLVENYRPGAFKALGLGYADLSKLNPKLVYASMSAFGQDGPRSSHTAYDPAIQASSGITASTGTKDSGPIKCGASVIDYATGLAGAFAISAALYQRLRTGEGQHIDMSMLDVALILQGNRITDYLRTGKLPQRGDHRPFAANSAYETKSGLIQLACSNLRQQRRFFEAIDMPDKAVRTSYEDSKAQYETEWKAVAAKMKERTADEWEAYLQSKHVPAARVRELREAVEDPQLTTRGVFHQHGNIPDIGAALRVPLAAFKFAHDGPSVGRAPPRVGEHTNEVLAIAGYDAGQITALRKAAVVA